MALPVYYEKTAVPDEKALAIEEVLRNYYRKQTELKNKKQLLNLLDRNILDTKKTLLCIYENIPVREAAAQYKAIVGNYLVNDLKAQTYYEFTSTLEQYRNYLLQLRQRRLKIKMRILYIEEETEGAAFALSQMEPVDQFICEKSYGIPGVSNIQIGMELNMNEKAIRYRRKRIVARLSKIPGFNLN